jgi:AcrR family transcriptional regulator
MALLSRNDLFQYSDNGMGHSDVLDLLVMSDPVRLRARSDRAIRNDARIKAAAREVFLADPHAPITAVAEAAGMGISALYSRYANKDELLRSLSDDGLTAYIDAADRALDNDDAGAAFTSFLYELMDADVHSMTQRLAGSFKPDERLRRRSEQGREKAKTLLERAQRASAVRDDLLVDDLSFVLEQIAAVRLADPKRTHQLRSRYLGLLLDALRPEPGHRPLTGPGPTWPEIAARWEA